MSRRVYPGVFTFAILFEEFDRSACWAVIADTEFPKILELKFVIVRGRGKSCRFYYLILVEAMLVQTAISMNKL